MSGNRAGRTREENQLPTRVLDGMEALTTLWQDLPIQRVRCMFDAYPFDWWSAWVSANNYVAIANTESTEKWSKHRDCSGKDI